MARIHGETHEQYINRVIKESIESFIRYSNKHKIEYIEYLCEVAKRPYVRRNYKEWFNFLILILDKTRQFEKLKEFYEGLGDNEKKEFQTELHEAILAYHEIERCISEEDKQLKELYDLDNIDSEIEKRKNMYIEKNDSKIGSGLDEKIIINFIEECSPKVFEGFKEAIEDFNSVMKNNLSSRTRKELFSLPADKRAYVYMEMYSTARFYEFDDWYLTDRYDDRKRLRDKKKQEAQTHEETNKNGKDYVKRKYPLIKPRM